MGKRKTIAERLLDMAGELRGRLYEVDMRNQGLVVPPDSLYAVVRRDMGRLVSDMEDLATRSSVGVLSGSYDPDNDVTH